MKKYFIALLILLFIGCTSQTKILIDNNEKNDTEVLLKTIIQKEKQINELNKKLEFYENKKTNK